MAQVVEHLPSKCEILSFSGTFIREDQEYEKRVNLGRVC
jgi:hypothetical protein